jgi:hypothetical protein
VATLTARDIAQRIQRPGEQLRAATDRLRNWTKEGLIKPVGDLHPGTGRKKRYAQSAVRRAMLLQIFSDATGGAAVFLAGMVDNVEPMLEEAIEKNAIFVIARRFDNPDQFEVTTWLRKDLGKALSNSKADVHIVFDPRRILEEEPNHGKHP